MNYLFFDIECANCDEGKGKICTFGYLLTDENFQVLEQEDIVVNPDAPFHLTGRRDKRDITLSYTREEFLNAPKLPHFWDKIVGLLTEPDTMVWGYATVNDINFLLSEAIRYSLVFPDLVYYDVQAMYADYKSVRDVLSLERAVGEQGVEVGDDHNSLCDARYTMIVARSMATNLGLKLHDIIPLSPRVKGEVSKGEKILSTTPKRAKYDEIKASLYQRGVEFGEKTIEEVNNARDSAFDIYRRQKRILHNYVTVQTKSSTIGELLKGFDFEE